jgi:hypothetical protein
MNEAVIGLVAALGGALIALLGSYVLNIRSEFASRAKALQELRDSLEATRQIIDAFDESDDLWSASTQLAPAGWHDYQRDLMSCFKPGSWSELRRFIRRLEVADRWAEGMRVAAATADKGFSENLAGIYADLAPIEGKLKDAQVAARSHVGFGRATIFGVVAAPIAAVVIVAILLAPGPRVTSDSLSRALRVQLPGAQSVICDKSSTVEGGYTCTAAFPRCAQEPIASTKPVPCSGVRDAVYQVATQKTSFNATLSKEVGGQVLTGATGGLRKLLIITGFVKP